MMFMYKCFYIVCINWFFIFFFEKNYEWGNCRVLLFNYILDNFMLYDLVKWMEKFYFLIECDYCEFLLFFY